MCIYRLFPQTTPLKMLLSRSSITSKLLNTIVNSQSLCYSKFSARNDSFNHASWKHFLHMASKFLCCLGFPPSTLASLLSLLFLIFLISPTFKLWSATRLSSEISIYTHFLGTVIQFHDFT